MIVLVQVAITYTSRFWEASVRLSRVTLTRSRCRGSPIGIRRSSVANTEFRGALEPGGPSKNHMYTGITGPSVSSRTTSVQHVCY